MHIKPVFIFALVSFLLLTAPDGREWIGDARSKFISIPTPQGKSRSSSPVDKSFMVHPVPYLASRISSTEFHYTFQVNPGQKFFRLHFYPASYRGFEKYRDFFTVKAGSYTLLKDLSASLTADALGLKYLVKEFCLNAVETGDKLRITFSASQGSNSRQVYAFVNGIEIISMPAGLYFTPDGDLGAYIVGQDSRFYIDNRTALEMIQRLNIGGRSISAVEDFGMFRRWSGDGDYLQESGLLSVNHLVHMTEYTNMLASIAPLKIYQTSWTAGKKEPPKKMHHLTWKIPVDLGFGYLVRLHFYSFDPETSEEKLFTILINNQIVEVNGSLIKWNGGYRNPVYRDYVVILRGDKESGRHDLLVALHSASESAVELFKGLEVLKLSNPDNSLASANPVFPKPLSKFWTINVQSLMLAISKRCKMVNYMTILIIILNAILFKFKQARARNNQKERDSRSASPSPSSSYCVFSLAEIISATQNFSDATVIGKGTKGRLMGFQRLLP